MSDRVVTVYSKDNCVQCNATYKDLERKGVDYSVDDIYAEENFAMVQELNYMSAPVVTVRENGELVDHWSGFRPDKIDELV